MNATPVKGLFSLAILVFLLAGGLTSLVLGDMAEAAMLSAGGRRIVANPAVLPGPVTRSVPMPLADVPGTPSLVGSAGNGLVVLTWQPPASDGGSSITSYLLYRDTISGLRFNEWKNAGPSASPGPLESHSMAYDAVFRKVVLFGGFTYSGVSGETWVYDAAVNAWTNQSPLTAPRARAWHGMTYEATSGKVVLFGGTVASSQNSETWVYDTSTNVWTNKSPVAAPSARFTPAMVYDASVGKVILFGGMTSSGLNGETWVYDVATNNWTKRNPTGAPSPRDEHALAYDATTRKVILFGGRTSLGNNGETWAYDTAANTWTNKSPAIAPSPREEHAMVYDAALGKTVLFGGGSKNDTWVYDASLNTWTELRPANGPSWQNRHAMAYDAVNGKVTLYGGTNGGRETWTYPAASPLVALSNVTSYIDRNVTGGVVYYYRVAALNSVGLGPTSNEVSATPKANVPSMPRNLTANGGNGRVTLSWRPSASDGGSTIANYQVYRVSTVGSDLVRWTNMTSGFEPRYGHGLTYLPRDGTVLVFGGCSVYPSCGYSNTTWVYYPSSDVWSNATRFPSPGPRASHALVYAGNDALLFGGCHGSLCGTYDGDTWMFNVSTSTWQRLMLAGPPAARMGHAMAYDPKNGKVILFGGYNGNTLADTWVFDVTAKTWSKRNPSSSPPARNGHGMVYDLGLGKVVLFGGLTGPTYYNDIWVYDVVADAWNQLITASGPSPRSGMAMVYDEAEGRTTIFGGCSGTSCGTVNAESWSFDSSNKTWTRIGALTPPSARTTSMAYDTRNSELILFGGWNWSALSDVWAYPYPAGTLIAILGNTTTFIDTGLTNGMTYYYRVAARNAVGLSRMSNGVSASPRTVPDAPASISAFPGDAQVSLSWTAPPNGGSAVQFYGVYGGTSPYPSTVVGNTTSTSWTHSGLTNGLPYYYRISAHNAAGEGARSAEVLSVPRTVPAAPASVSASPGDGQVSLSWSAAGDGGSAVQFYLVYGSPSPNPAAIVGNTTSLSWTETGLVNGRTYYYRVSASNVAGEGARSSEVSSTPRTVPGAPESITAVPGDAQVSLSWIAPLDGGSAIQFYWVYGGISPSPMSVVGNSTIASWTQTGLTNGQVHYYRVTAVNAAGKGPFSAEVTVTPISASTEPNSPANTPPHMPFAAIVVSVGIAFIAAVFLRRRAAVRRPERPKKHREATTKLPLEAQVSTGEKRSRTSRLANQSLVLRATQVRSHSRWPR